MRRKEREIKDIAEIEKIIGECDACRVAFANNNEPYIVALNFGYKEGNPPLPYFHCAPAGKKIDMLKINNNVYFQMDCDHIPGPSGKACNFGMKYGSVAGSGNIFIVEDEIERKTELNAIIEQYTGKDNFDFDPNVMKATLVLRLEISEISGKRKS